MNHLLRLTATLLLGLLEWLDPIPVHHTPEAETCPDCGRPAPLTRPAGGGEAVCLRCAVGGGR